jgi:hypothetical protein
VKRALGFVIALTVVVPEVSFAQSWKIQPLEIRTRWAQSINTNNILPEYPRPQLVRQRWQNLNGLWQYAITSKDASRPPRYDGNILVPYPVESALSGVQRPLLPDQLLWYRRTFIVTPERENRRLLLHFGAIDYKATVYLNDVEVGSHTGGYESFTLDVTRAVKLGTNNLVVKVFDPTDAGPNPHGKQSLHPEDIFYTSTSGIWQTVWLETVPSVYIEGLVATPNLDRKEVRLEVRINGVETDQARSQYTIQAIVKDGSTVATGGTVNGVMELHIDHPHLWSPDAPFLYDLDVRLLKDGRVVDEAGSYFGMRKVELKRDLSGRLRIFLNGRYTYNLGVLEQGFWPDGLYTAPTDAALKFDIQAVKAMGFNTVRMHAKVESDRWYYYCDSIGLLVWQDMVPPANGSREARAQFENEVTDNISRLRNHPSIITWVLFNEGWGAYDQERLANWIKTLDPTRLLDAHSGANVPSLAGWRRHLQPAVLAAVLSGDHDPLVRALREVGLNEPRNWAGGDLTDIHVYPGPESPPAEPEQADVLGEYGGIETRVDGHTWHGLAGLGDAQLALESMGRTYADMVAKLKSLEASGLTASIYTQPYDVEEERNGLMTYDREVMKIPVEEVARVNTAMVPRAKNYSTATHGLSVKTADLRPLSQRYGALLAAYRKGERDPEFIKRFVTLAIQQRDQGRATEAANQLIEGMAQPYSKDAWQFIQATARTSRDKGFQLLRTQTQQADRVLGENSAERTVREVISREEIGPYAPRGRTPNWRALEASVGAKYGELGTEAIYGAEMIYYLRQENWSNFGKYYALYFQSATNRSEYSINDLSYALFTHVTDPAVLETAIRVCRITLDASEARGDSSPAEIDTYASLLYKLGKHREALEWEEKAARLGAGYDEEIMDHLKKMRSPDPYSG